jgi:anti-sigma factor RsiW
MSEDDNTRRAQMALDGELDAVHQFAFDEALAQSPELAAEYARLQALRETIRAHAPREAAPERLRARIEALAAAAPEAAAPASRPLPPARVRVAWGSIAAAFVAVAALAGYWAGGRSDDPTMTALVAGYQRAELSGQQVDVASSDRHTVKPWFTTHAPLGALVLDLVADGYPLIGGRLDIVAGKPVPTLVYRRGGHIIAVSEFPLSTAESGPTVFEGYHIRRWRDRERAYVAVSDIEAEELDAFVAEFVKKAGG